MQKSENNTMIQCGKINCLNYGTAVTALFAVTINSGNEEAVIADKMAGTFELARNQVLFCG